MVRSNDASALENAEYFFTPSLPGPLSIVWNGTVLTFDCVWTKTILILNWTVWLDWITWNRNVFDN